MYVEDYLELFVGLHKEQKAFKFFATKNDEVLMFSLGRQVMRGISLTDRQYELAKRKLLEYKEQFEVYGFDSFKDDLTQKVSWIICNKIDLIQMDDIESVKSEIKKDLKIKSKEIFFISAATGEGTNELLKSLETEVLSNKSKLT